MTTRITTDNITDGTIVTADIADDGVTTAKIASLNTIQILASDGSTVVKTIFTPGS